MLKVIKPVFEHSHGYAFEFEAIRKYVYDNMCVPMIFSVFKISMKRVVSNVCGFNMFNFVLIGFMIQFVRSVQCVDAVNVDQSSSADKLIFVHAVNKQTIRLISHQIYQLRFSELFTSK